MGLPQPRAASRHGEWLPQPFLSLLLPYLEPLVLGNFLRELTRPAPVSEWGKKQNCGEAHIQGLET